MESQKDIYNKKYETNLNRWKSELNYWTLKIDSIIEIWKFLKSPKFWFLKDLPKATEERNHKNILRS